MANTETLVRASCELTLDTNPTANDTVTVGAKTYTFVASPAAEDDIDIGADAEESLDNLIAAINGGDGSGTAYHADTEPNEQVRARKTAATTAEMEALVPGVIGNGVATTETFTAGTNVFEAASLAGGTGSIGDFINSLIDLNQINSEVISELRKLTAEVD